MLYNPPVGATDPNAAYIQGNAALGVQGSKPPAIGFETAQREIFNAIAAAGLTPTNADLTQLTQALAKAAVPITIGGTANALTGTIATFASPASTSPGIVPGMRVSGVIATTNTGAATLTVAPLGALPIVGANGGALTGQEMTSGQSRSWMLDATAAHWILQPIFAAPAQLLATSGYRKFDGGLILQWGQGTLPIASSSTTSSAAVVYPISFPTGTFAVLATAAGGANAANGYIPSMNATGLSLSGFNATGDTLTGTAATKIYFTQTCPFLWASLGH